MGRLWVLWFSKKIEQLEEFKATLKDPAKIAEVQQSIDELKAEQAKNETKD